jgi:hypothetical protein
MSYLVCNKCGGYYELQPGDSLDNFDLQCGGRLKYYNSLDNHYNKNNQESNLIKLILIILAILLIFGILGIILTYFYELHKYGLFILPLINL